MTETEMLKKIPLFSGLGDDQLGELGQLMRAERFGPQQPVFWIGEQGTDFHVVQHGAVSVVVPDETGKEVILANLGPGNFFGEISLLDGSPRTASIRSMTETTLLKLSRDDFHRFLLAHPSAAVNILATLARRNREMIEKVRGIRNVNEVIDQSRTRWNVLADRIAEFSASKIFILANLIFFGTWCAVNLANDRWAFDPAPFELLGFIIGIEGMFISLFVLISQNQEGERERVRAELDYQVNLKAHLEVMQLHQKIDRLQRTLSEGAGAQPGQQQ